jgi:hypothetical protein
MVGTGDSGPGLSQSRGKITFAIPTQRSCNHGENHSSAIFAGLTSIYENPTFAVCGLVLEIRSSMLNGVAIGQRTRE